MKNSFSSHSVCTALFLTLHACTSSPTPADVPTSDSDATADRTVVENIDATADRPTVGDTFVPIEDSSEMADISSMDGSVTNESGVECAPGLGMCNGDCVDLVTDPNNCGVCGRMCALGERCSDSNCQAPCLAGETRCGGICVNLLGSDSNCGICGRACPAGETCNGGACMQTCPAGQSACGGSCVNTQTDVNHCGICNMRCAAGLACIAGRCQSDCPIAGQLRCGGVCINPLTDRANCGRCGTACAMNQVCSVGACAAGCAAPTTNCSGLCLDTATNVANCGACGRACSNAPNANPTCAMSTCGLRCNAGFGNCDMNAINGCETNTVTSSMHCGACGNVCTPNANQTVGCVDSSCKFTCSAGFGDCDMLQANGCETNTNTTTTHCGACGNVCAAPVGGVAACVAGSCSGTCSMGQSFCPAGAGGAVARCVNLQTDANNCGRCSNVCPMGQSCNGGLCTPACMGGLTGCSGMCVDTQTTNAHCGACGRACPAGATCTQGTCLSPFRITTINNAMCTTVEGVRAYGDQRMTIAPGVNRVLVGGDQSTGSFNATTLAGGTAIAEVQDGLVADLTAGQSYQLGDGTGPIKLNTGIRMVDRLWRRSTTGVWTPNAPIMLSRAIAIDTTQGANQGFYSGAGRIAIHTDRLYEILLPAGAVSERLTSGNMAVPQPFRTPSPSFASYGVVENSGTNLFLLFVQNSTTVARMNVAANTVAVHSTFMNLGDASSIAVDVVNNRWLWRYAAMSELGALAEAIVSCPTTLTNIAGTFTVNTLTLNAMSCVQLDVSTRIGATRGALIATGGNVWTTGNSATVRVSGLPANFILANVRTVGPAADHVIANLADGQLYGLFAGSIPVFSGNGVMNVDRIVPLAEATLRASGAAITLSQSIPIDTTSGSLGNMLALGWNRTLIVTGGRLWNIELPAGIVRNLGPIALPSHEVAEGWAPNAIVESQGATTSVVFVASSSLISRFVVGGALTNVSNFTNLGNQASIAFNPRANLLYFQSQGVSQFSMLQTENVGICPATFSN